MTDPETVRHFLHEAFTFKPESLYLLIWTLADKRSRWFLEPNTASAAVTALGPQDIYCGVGLSSRDYGPAERCPSDEIAGIVGLWADFDLRSDAHPNKALPASIPDALSIIPGLFPPSMVIATGNGAHAWWLFKEPLVFDDAEGRLAASKLVTEWQTVLRLNAATKGWSFDRLADLARVLRIPGTVNAKDPKNPKPVTIVSDTGRRYNPSDFEEWIEEAGTSHLVAAGQDADKWAEYFRNHPLVINLNAEIPIEKIEQWIAADSRFRSTWFKQRPDLKDQSQSGYDMALADFGRRAGLNDQQIADLIIHHRRIHNQKPRTRPDYYERTIAKASDTAREITTPSKAFEQEIAQRNPENQQDRALLCEQLSKILGIHILRIIKVKGKEATYLIELENATLEASSIKKLIDQQNLRYIIADGVRHLIPKIKPKDWELVAQMILDSLTEVDGSPETDLIAATKLYLDHYLMNTAIVRDIDDLSSLKCFNPIITDGQISICSSELRSHISTCFDQQISHSSLASMLIAIGARTTRLKSRGPIRDQRRWLLSADDFPPTHYITTDGEADKDNHDDGASRPATQP
jgi:hypothetical protein